jgi:hypothetical protein
MKMNSRIIKIVTIIARITDCIQIYMLQNGCKQEGKEEFNRAMEDDTNIKSITMGEI